MSFTDKWEREVMNYLFNATPITLPSSFYIGLHVGGSAPTDAGTGFTEPSTGAYARVAATRDTTAFPTTTTGVITNGIVINFPTPTANWGTVTHFGVFDSSPVGVGNALVIATLTASKVIAVGDTPQFAIGSLSFTLA